jgi:hypothetical protein
MLGRRPSLAVPVQQGRAHNPLFFGSVLHGFLEDFVLQCLLAEHALKLGDLGASSGELRGRHHRLACADRSQGPLPVELAPLESKLAATPFWRATRDTLMPGS